MRTDSFFCYGILIALAASAVGCVAQDLGYQQTRSSVQQRLKQDVRWYHQEGAGAAEEQIRELVKKPLSSDAAVQLALLNNPEMQAQFEQIGVARAELVSAWKLPNPRVSAELMFHGSEQPEIGLEATMSLSRLLGMQSRVHIAGKSVERAKLQVLAAAIDLSYEVRGQFLKYQVKRASLKLLRERVAAANMSYTVARRLHEAGNLNDLELASERVVYEEARLLLAAAEQAERSAKLELGGALGLWQRGTEFGVELDLPELPAELTSVEKLSLDELTRRALKQSVQLSVLKEQYAERAGRANLEAWQASLPDIGAGVGVERKDDKWGVGPVIHLDLPLFDQGQGALSREESALRRIEHQSSSAAIQIRTASARLLQELKAARSRAKYYQETLLPLRRQVSQETLLAYNAMDAGVFQLMEARKEELHAEQQSLAALGQFWLAHSRLEQLLAGGSSRGLSASSEDAEM